MVARTKTGKKWLGHLPETFSDKMIVQLFHGLETGRAAPAVKKYHNTHLRLNPKEFASLKYFAGLNKAQYVRFSRILFYYTGLRMLAAITEPRRL